MGLSDMQKSYGDEVLKKTEVQFDADTAIIAEQTGAFVQVMHPAYLVESKEDVLKLTYQNADAILEELVFYRLVSCTVEDIGDMFAYFNEKMSQFFTAVYSIGKPIIYGVVSYQGVMNILIGICGMKYEKEIIKGIMEGLLDGIELQPYTLNVVGREAKAREVGMISAIPTIKVGDEKQKFNIVPLLKSLNGHDYTILFVSRPLTQDEVSDKYGEVIRIRDACFAVSKRNISSQHGTSHSVTETEGHTETDSHSKSTGKSKGGSLGLSFIIGANRSNNRSTTVQDSHSAAESYSKSIADAVNSSEGIASDVQNGFAVEMMSYADKAIERLRQGRNNGMWDTVISYSADSGVVAGIIQASISGEMAKPNPDILPPVVHYFQLSPLEAAGNTVLLPRIVKGEKNASPLCTAVTSEELGLMCTLPSEPVPNFELKKGKGYPLVTDNVSGIRIGVVCDGHRELNNMQFSFSCRDLVRHTFVCGITGSGKTTTVKNILRNAGTPFLVIESAKKEYRNISLGDNAHPVVYTLGKPEINCLRFNPFYIQCGVSPQMHIDFLKDLFNVSFSFYGPMPYILEKSLQNIYLKKGWNLILGFHPYLVNTNNPLNLFEAEYMQERYSQMTHKFLFPTMQDLKEEIERYIEEEMQYEGEVAGNIKTAIKARLESLCSGAKGYMFNTYEYADMNDILNRNSVFELEGLADDSDKAFCVGLLIIFINEYRQIMKESCASKKELEHLLVIEEAHRLLKNVGTERISEDMGNPKGKAVEHFTNMIAEMRSYGQGVIIAEQIPSKLAPDVIKNSSNKIIQRLVAADDQKLVASTIGLKEQDAVYIGNIRTGMALCHKEGMSLPVSIKIPMITEVQVSDGNLYRGDVLGRMQRIGYSIAKEAIVKKMDLWALKILNTILIQSIEEVKEALKWYNKQLQSELRMRGTDIILCGDKDKIRAELLAEAMIRYLTNGVYSIKQLVSDELSTAILNLFTNPSKEKLEKMKDLMGKAYRDKTEYRAKYIIAQLVINGMKQDTDVINSIRQYFVCGTEEIVLEIKMMVEKGEAYDGSRRCF